MAMNSHPVMLAIALLTLLAVTAMPPTALLASSSISRGGPLVPEFSNTTYAFEALPFPATGLGWSSLTNTSPNGAELWHSPQVLSVWVTLLVGVSREPEDFHASFVARRVERPRWRTPRLSKQQLLSLGLPSTARTTLLRSC
jgi:hypothetical protein